MKATSRNHGLVLTQLTDGCILAWKFYGIPSFVCHKTNIDFRSLGEVLQDLALDEARHAAAAVACFLDV